MPKQLAQNKLSKKTQLALFALVFILLMIDQCTKLYVNHSLALHQQVPVIPGFFNITLAYNKGAAFSFLADQAGWQRWFFSSLALVVSVFLVVWIVKLKKEEMRMGLALALILSGALGNLIDRVAYGHVIDFLDVYYQTRHWPAFNVADSAVCLGAAIMILLGFKDQGGS